jgi:hypothetical protein
VHHPIPKPDWGALDDATATGSYRAPYAARVSASLAILDRGYGRPASFSTGDSQSFKRAIDMTDDELATIASGATLHVVSLSSLKLNDINLLACEVTS